MHRHTLRDLRKIGLRRPNVIQIAPPRRVVRPTIVHDDDEGAHELVTRPLASPTGPGGAKGFTNKAGSQIAQPHVTNVYLGPFWGEVSLVEDFSKALLENGYLDPLRELGYGTGSGTYLGKVDGPALAPGSTFSDSDAQTMVQQLMGDGTLKGDENSLFVLILPDGVTSTLNTDQSCTAFCGYHEVVAVNGVEIAYAVLPSSLCAGCGGKIEDFTAVYAHEVAEACTDKVPGQGWTADDGSENGDLEAWILFGWGPPDDPNRFTVQGYYTNERGNTIGVWHD